MEFIVDHIIEYVHSCGWKYRAEPDPDTDGAYVKITYHEWDDVNKIYVNKGIATAIPPNMLKHLGAIADTIATGMSAETI